MQILEEKKETIVLFAFRKAHKKFFNAMLDYCRDADVTSISSKGSYLLSIKGLKSLPLVDLSKACDFAIAEFYAKTELPVPRLLLALYFKLFSVINYLRYFKALDKHYSKMLIWNGGKFRQLIALEAAKIQKIKVYFFENGLLPNTIVFDEKGINYHNSVPREKAFYETYASDVALPTALVPRVGKDRAIFKGSKEALPNEYIFVPFQVDYDTQIISQSPWIKNMRMLFDIIEMVAEETGYYFVFKEHPSSGIEYADLHQRAQESTYLSFQNSYSTQELIEKSSAVITVNSTVGIESLLFYKKVIVLGNAFYAIDGITYRAENRESLRRILTQLDQLELDRTLVENFLKYLSHAYLIPKDESMYKIFCEKLLKSNG